jgi:hypothetical protein
MLYARSHFLLKFNTLFGADCAQKFGAPDVKFCELEWMNLFDFSCCRLHALTDEINDCHYVAVDGTDGRVHYADIGNQKPGTLPDKGMIAALEVSDQNASNRQRGRRPILSYRNLDKFAATDGPTWLDRKLTSKDSTHITHQGLGADVRAAFGTECSG